MPPSRPICAPLSRLLAAFLVAGCAGRGSAEGDLLPDAEGRRRSALAIQQVAVSAPQASFTAVTAVDVDSRGRVYVGDWYRQQVTILGPDGSLVRTLGKRGDGPGEFRAIRGVQILSGDSLLVYDPTSARVTVYAADSVRPAYTTNLRTGLTGPAPFYLWRTAANDGYVALFRPTFAFSEGQSLPPRNDAVRLLALTGATRGEIKSFPSRGFLVAGSSVMPNPFGREGLVASDSRGRTHLLWSDSLALESFAADGQPMGRVVLPHAPLPVSAADVERQMDDWDGGTRATFSRTLQDSTPARWPAASALLVDDQDRIWIALVGAPSTTEWIVLSADKRYLATIVVPARVTLRAVSGDRLYAERLDENDVPSIVTYRVTGLLR
jgi:hypothetical protein